MWQYKNFRILRSKATKKSYTQFAICNFTRIQRKQSMKIPIRIYSTLKSSRRRQKNNDKSFNFIFSNLYIGQWAVTTKFDICWSLPQPILWAFGIVAMLRVHGQDLELYELCPCYEWTGVGIVWIVSMLSVDRIWNSLNCVHVECGQDL